MSTNLDDMKRDDLMALAKRLNLKGLSDKDKPTIRTAIEAQQARLEAEAAEGKLKPPEEDAPMGEPLTAEQREKLRAASMDQIQTVMADPEMPVLWRQEFKAEMDARHARKRADTERDRMTSHVVRYKVTKGGPFAVGGRICQVRTGGIVLETTHDLADLRRQGIEFEELKGKVVITETQLGRPTTAIVDEPRAAVDPQGDAPTPAG